MAVSDFVWYTAIAASCQEACSALLDSREKLGRLSFDYSRLRQFLYSWEKSAFRGTISKKEQKEITEDYSTEAIKEFNDIVDEELADVLEDEFSNMELSSEEQITTKSIDLDCGAQVVVTNEITKEDDSQEEASLSDKVKNFFILEASASTASYGNFKYGTYIKVIGVGTVSLNVTNHLTASKSGLTIRKVTASTNSSGQMFDVGKNCKIVKKSAGKGQTCKTLAGVRWYCNTPYGHLPKKWKKLTSSFKVTSINTSKKKVN